MKKSLTLLTASVFAVSAGLATLSVSACAAPTTQMHRCEHRMLRLHHPEFCHHRVWNLGLRHNKHLTANNARTITEAALLMHSRKNLHVGKIDSKQLRGHKLYIIQIKNKKQKVIRLVKMNSRNGFIRPVRLHKA